MMTRRLVKSIVKPGESGNWKVDKYRVTKREAELANLRAAFNPGRGSYHVEPGWYTRLLLCSEHGTSIVMSDSPDEISHHREFVRVAHGNVLVNGLGLGVCLQMLCMKPVGEIKRITVIERSPDVIKLVSKYFTDEIITIINDDAFTWKPPRGTYYNAVWHDIWNDICTDNLTEMKTLHRRYGRRCQWQGSWSREFIDDNYR